MRGADSYNESLFTTVTLEKFVPATHPLRPIREWVNDALARMKSKYSGIAASTGAPAPAYALLARLAPQTRTWRDRSQRTEWP